MHASALTVRLVTQFFLYFSLCQIFSFGICKQTTLYYINIYVFILYAITHRQIPTRCIDDQSFVDPISFHFIQTLQKSDSKTKGGSVRNYHITPERCSESRHKQ